MTLGFIFIALLIAVATLYLRKFVATKAENLAQKQDLKDLTTVVERVKSQFERANTIYQMQAEAEFSACVNTWREACLAHKEFCRLNPIAEFGSQLANQAELFAAAQIKFTDTLQANRPLMRDDVWKAFDHFEWELVAWKDQPTLPLPLRKEARDKARRALDECNHRIKNRFKGEVYLPGID